MKIKLKAWVIILVIDLEKDSEANIQKLISSTNKKIKESQYEYEEIKKKLEHYEVLRQRLHVFYKVLNNRKAYMTKEFLDNKKESVKDLIGQIHSLFLESKVSECITMVENRF